MRSNLLNQKPYRWSMCLEWILWSAAHKIKLGHFSIGPVPMIWISVYDRQQRLLQYLVPIAVDLLRLSESPNSAPNTIRFHEMMTESTQRGTVNERMWHFYCLFFAAIIDKMIEQNVTEQNNWLWKMSLSILLNEFDSNEFYDFLILDWDLHWLTLYLVYGCKFSTLMVELSSMLWLR